MSLNPLLWRDVGSSRSHVHSKVLDSTPSTQSILGLRMASVIDW